MFTVGILEYAESSADILVNVRFKMAVWRPSWSRNFGVLANNSKTDDGTVFVYVEYRGFEVC